MNRPGFKLLLGATVLCLLAACSTAPQMPKVPAYSVAAAQAPGVATASVMSPALGLPASPDMAVVPGNPTQDEPASNALRPALLAGEFAREFERGGASWYGPGFHGRRTASGERYDMNAFTAAHRTLPFGTWVRVQSLVNGRQVDVRITDRGPFIRSRVIDVSRRAADALGMLGLGFKEVVLLVPESTADGLDLSSSAVKGRRRAALRVLKPR